MTDSLRAGFAAWRYAFTGGLYPLAPVVRYRMRSWLVVVVCVFGCGDDSGTIEPDAGADGGVQDSGTDAGSDASVDVGLDAADDDAGSDAGVDAPADVFDAGPTLCDPTATGPTFPSREWDAVVVADGDEFLQPVSMDWDGTRMLVSNSASWLTTDPAVGNTLQVIDGVVSVLASGASFQGPAASAWNNGDGAFEAGFYVAVEDAAGPGVLRVAGDGSSVTTFGNATEPGAIVFGRGGDWGADLYVAARERADTVMPNPFGVYEYGSDGMRTPFAITLDGAPLVGAFGLAFGPGDTLGTDLYVATFEDGGFSPGSTNAIYRVASDGTASLLAAVDRPIAIATPDTSTGDFGEFVYVSTSSDIVRVDSTGSVETFAEGFDRAAYLRFGPDGALYVAEPGGARIVRIERCPDI